MPENKTMQGEAILILNQRFKNRLMMAVSCLGYFISYLAAESGLSAGLQSFLVPSATMAVILLVIFTLTWIRTTEEFISTSALVCVGLVTLHLTGSLLTNQFRLEIVAVLIALIVLVNLCLGRLKEIFLFNILFVSVSGFVLSLRKTLFELSSEAISGSLNYYTVPPIIFWLNAFIASAIMLLIRVYLKRPAVPAEKIAASAEKEKTVSLTDNPAATFLVNPSTGIIFDCNDAAIQLFDGYTKEDFVGKNLNHFRNDQWNDSQRKEFQRTLGRKGKAAVNAEFLTLKDRLLKTVFAIHSSASESGEKYYHATVTEAISPRQVAPTPAPEKPAAGEDKSGNATLVIENSDYAIVSIDRNHIIQVLNSKLSDGLYELTGVRIQPGFNLRELIPTNYIARYNDIFSKAMQGESSLVEEHLELLKGKNLEIEVQVNPVYSPGGQITGVSFFGTDISGRKRNEMELVHAREQALAEVRAKSAFLATMSHEIRTPLNGVIGMSKLLEHTPLTAKQKEYVSSLVLSGEALLSVINDILDYSKMESSKMTLERKPFAVKRCIEETFDLLAAKAHEKNLKLHYSIHREVPTFIAGDITRVRQVLLNLVSNAIKFTPHGRIEIQVSVEKKIQANTYLLRFEVRDTGIGIPKNKIGRLFQVYSQAEEETSRKYGGTGLGLAISKNLVELMGGTISVHSEEGKGSSFLFTIEAEKAASSELIQKSSQAAKQLVNSQALIISDDENTALLFGEYFNRWGMKTVSTDNTVELFELLRSNEKFQVLAIDAKMSSEKSSGVAERARALRGSEELSIVLFNADDKENLSFDYTGEIISAVIPAEIDRSKILNILLGIFSEESLRTRHEAGLTKFDKEFAARLPLNILVAEDNNISQKLAAAIFEGLGYTIDLADDGKQAVEKIKGSKYDIVFMDVQMPEMDGFEATQFILKKLNLHTPPVIIAMTAFALEGDREKCLQAGMNDYISKPILVEEIADKLLRWGKGKGEPGIVEQEKTSGAPLLDQNVISRLRELNEKVEKGFFAEVVNMFLKQAPAIINEMILYCNNQRYDKMSQAAHKLKGSALNLGASALAELCRRLEIKGKRNEAEDCIVDLEELRTLYGVTEQELKKLID